MTMDAQTFADLVSAGRSSPAELKPDEVGKGDVAAVTSPLPSNTSVTDKDGSIDVTKAIRNVGSSSEAAADRLDSVGKPGPASIDLASVLKTVQAASGEMASRTALAQTQAVAQKTSQNQLEDLMGSITNVQNQINYSGSQDKLKAAAEKQRLAGDAGVDPNDISTYLLPQLLDQQREATQRYVKAASDLNQAQSQSFSDNPLNWIWNQMMIPGQRERVKDAEQEVTGITQTVRDLATSVNTGVDEIDKFSHQFNESDAAQELTLKSMQMAAEGLKQKIADYSTGITELQKLNNMDEMQITAVRQGLASLQEDRAQRLRQAQFDFEKERFAQLEQDKKEKSLDDNTLVGLANTGRLARGDPNQYTLADLKMVRLTGKGPLSEIFQHDIIAGTASSAAHAQGDSDFRAIGTTPGDVAVFAKTSGAVIANSALQRDRVLPLLRSSLDQALQTTGGKITPDTPETINNLVAAHQKQDATNAERPGSLIAQTSLQYLLAGNPALVNTKLYTEVLKPYAEQGLDKIDANWVIKTAAKAVADKKITLEEAAAGTSFMYRYGLQKVQADMNLSGMGIPISTSYKAVVNSNPAIPHIPFMRSATEMTDYTQVLSALNLETKYSGLKSSPFAGSMLP